ncbi:MAG: SRPBCC domain-containing protein [Planctomycetia bacterium]|nr:SRPBCC domain-containing protein [Planctomycetia bacterium]
MNARIEARVSHRFKASAERVYDAWLNPEKVRAWMAAALRSFGLAGDIRRIEIDARVGGKFYFSDMRDGTEATHWGTYLELDRPRKIVFTWIVAESEEANPSTVTLTIQSDSDGCVATIVHEMDAKWVDYVSRTETGWAQMLHEVECLLT